MLGGATKRQWNASGSGSGDTDTSKLCQIPSAVYGDPYPFAHCCGLRVEEPDGGIHKVTLDFTESACCAQGIESARGVCNAAEVNAKGGAIPCVNPLNRLAFWLFAWQQLLIERGGSTALLKGLVLDMESTGMGDATLAKGLRYYLDRYFGPGHDLVIGATSGLVLPDPNSHILHFDFWFVEAYNLFSARIGADPTTCEAFLVDSLPYTTAGFCGRHCKGLLCATVTPSCDTSIYEQHRNDPFGLAGASGLNRSRAAAGGAAITMKDLVLPETAQTAQELCTASWSHGLMKHYAEAYYAARKGGDTVAAAKAAAQHAVQKIFDRTHVLFSSEAVIAAGSAPTCLYPSTGSCGVPHAFGSGWTSNAFMTFVDSAFVELSLDVVMDDGTTDQISLSGLNKGPASRRGYAGVYQFSFLPLDWLPSTVAGMC